MTDNKDRFIFSGAATALITPFSGGEPDLPAIGRLIEYQISEGIDALVIGGTTGEISTLSDTERERLYNYCAETVRGRVPLIYGAGSNDTERACRYADSARRCGADAILVVSPYYNKGTDEGLERHFFKIADAGRLPVMLYNIPGRTGVNLTVEKLSRLSEHPNIRALKEAHDSAERLADIFSSCPRLAVYAGNDGQIIPTLALGGEGVVSVVSNIYPRTIHDICKLFYTNIAESRRLQLSLIPLIRALFRETNPAPVKYAASLMFGTSPECRLPLGDIRPELKCALRELVGSERPDRV